MEKGEEMDIKARVLSNDNEVTPEFSGLYGARFYPDADPTEPSNKVVKIYTVNTTHSVNSTTNIEGKALCQNPTAFVFEMRYYFGKIWSYSSKYLRLEFCNNANTGLFALAFNVAEGEDKLSAERLTLSMMGNSSESVALHSDRWYSLRFEYYRGVDSLSDSRLKIFLGQDGEEMTLALDIPISKDIETPSRALLIHHATKIRGIQYLDDISFTLLDAKYKKNAPALVIPDEQKRIYDFEDGIPSEKEFFIDMRLKKQDDFLSMDPATWYGAGKKREPSLSLGTYEIMLVQTGEARFITENSETPINEGSIIIVPPGLTHDVISDDKYNIISILGSFEHLSSFTEATVLRDNIYGEGKKLAELILYNRFNSEEYFTSLCNAFINFILLNIDSPKNNMNTTVYKMMDQIKKNYDNSEFSITKMLKESGYAKDYIRTKFFEIAKMTPKKYLTTIRMRRAKELLNLYGAEVGVAKVAEQCGIVDPAVFSKSFKQFYGVSPKQFLKQDE